MTTPISRTSTTTSPTARTAATTGSAQGATAKALSGTDALGKQEFLKLLTAQLKNQDPMKPMEDREFITQLAQFSSLEALENLNTRLETLAQTQTLSQASMMIGKRVNAKLPDGTQISGVVSQVTLVNGTPNLMIDGKGIELSHVTSVGG